jgi:cyclophilin family peptidyl-prolyl cis-trans isomerase
MHRYSSRILPQEAVRLAFIGALAAIATLAALAANPSAARAQRQRPTSTAQADTNRIRRILQAEDERDSTAGAFDDGFRSGNSRTRLLARVALARTRDSKFASRDSFPVPAAPPQYPEPAWRLRYRALATKPINCSALSNALSDSAWAVRLRALDLLAPECASDSAIMRRVTAWASTPPRTSKRARGGVSWHPAGHAIVALARLNAPRARGLLAPNAQSAIPWLRAYAARAAGILGDTSTLHRLARDANDNVKEAALDELAKLPGHAGDDDAIAALGARGYQAVRAGARALKGSPHGRAVFTAALAAALRIRGDSNEPSRDARLALVERLGEFATAADESALAPLATDFDCAVARASAAVASKLGHAIEPQCRRPAIVVPEDAVALALGRDVRLRVTLADSSGGGVFFVRLRGDIAPIMGARVMQLVNAHWYDDHPWFRVEPDFVIEGGGPGANEYVGHERFMRDELSSLPQVRGTIGMSTRGHDTGDGQWFVNLRDNQRLTQDYTTFAEVVDGMDVVDGILEGDVIQSIEIVEQYRSANVPSGAGAPRSQAIARRD